MCGHPSNRTTPTKASGRLRQLESSHPDPLRQPSTFIPLIYSRYNLLLLKKKLRFKGRSKVIELAAERSKFFITRPIVQWTVCLSEPNRRLFSIYPRYGRINFVVKLQRFVTELKGINVRFASAKIINHTPLFRRRRACSNYAASKNRYYRRFST